MTRWENTTQCNRSWVNFNLWMTAATWSFSPITPVHLSPMSSSVLIHLTTSVWTQRHSSVIWAQKNGLKERRNKKIITPPCKKPELMLRQVKTSEQLLKCLFPEWSLDPSCGAETVFHDLPGSLTSSLTFLRSRFFFLSFLTNWLVIIILSSIVFYEFLDTSDMNENIVWVQYF